MARKALQPVSVAGIEFDALIEEEKTMSATIPSYPVENGFPVSDTIILDPLSIQMTLYVTNTPVTWLARHGSSVDRVNKVCDAIENLWLEKKLVKVVTTGAIYTNMGITSISIRKSNEIGYAREISLQMNKVIVTESKTAKIPDYILKSGKTMANAGTASTTTSTGLLSHRTSHVVDVKDSSQNIFTSSSNQTNSNTAKKSQSILYGAATGLDFM